ncbi:unnamed protein product [Sphacelaria rigidula]
MGFARKGFRELHCLELVVLESTKCEDVRHAACKRQLWFEVFTDREGDPKSTLCSEGWLHKDPVQVESPILVEEIELDIFWCHPEQYTHGSGGVCEEKACLWKEPGLVFLI